VKSAHLKQMKKRYQMIMSFRWLPHKNILSKKYVNHLIINVFMLWHHGTPDFLGVLSH